MSLGSDRFSPNVERISVRLGADTTQTFDSGFSPDPANPVGIIFDNASTGLGVIDNGDNSGGAWDTSNGRLTAPRKGLYHVSMGLSFSSDQTMSTGAGFSIEARINNESGIGNARAICRFEQSYPDSIPIGQEIMLRGDADYFLNEGDTLSFIVRGSFGAGAILSFVSDGRLNWITIKEIPLRT